MLAEKKHGSSSEEEEEEFDNNDSNDNVNDNTMVKNYLEEGVLPVDRVLLLPSSLGRLSSICRLDMLNNFEGL